MKLTINFIERYCEAKGISRDNGFEEFLDYVIDFFDDRRFLATTSQATHLIRMRKRSDLLYHAMYQWVNLSKQLSDRHERIDTLENLYETMYGERLFERDFLKDNEWQTILHFDTPLQAKAAAVVAMINGRHVSVLCQLQCSVDTIHTFELGYEVNEGMDNVFYHFSSTGVYTIRPLTCLRGSYKKSVLEQREVEELKDISCFLSE